jgi:hypothetical protein
MICRRDERRRFTIPALPIGVAVTVLLAVDAPLTFAGGVSTGARTGVPGVPALRVLGWIVYGMSLAAAGTLVGLGAVKRTPPAGLVTGVAAMGTSAGMLFSVDDFCIDSQAWARAAALASSSARVSR